MLTPGILIHQRYRITRPIGQGGMSAVYAATDERLGNTVALKQLIGGGVDITLAFEQEARTLATLHHAALPRVIDYFSDPAGAFLVMEFIPGPDLSAQLAQQGHPFMVAQVLAWANQLLAALDYLHRRQVIHRDIKPQNLKCTADGDVILLDFGLAKQPAGQSVRGFTPEYAPLEQIQGYGTGPRSDLYSLAATLYHLLTGQPPATAIDRLMDTAQGRADPLAAPHTLNPQVPPEVSTILLWALTLDQDMRPASADALRSSLCLPDPQHMPYRAMSPPASAASSSRRSRPEYIRRTFMRATPVVFLVFAISQLFISIEGPYVYLTSLASLLAGVLIGIMDVSLNRNYYPNGTLVTGVSVYGQWSGCVSLMVTMVAASWGSIDLQVLLVIFILSLLLGVLTGWFFGILGGGAAVIVRVLLNWGQALRRWQATSRSTAPGSSINPYTDATIVPRSQPAPARRRYRWLWGSLGSALVVLLIAVSCTLLQSPPLPTPLPSTPVPVAPVQPGTPLPQLGVAIIRGTSPRVTELARWETASVNTVAFSPDGQILASGSGDEVIRLWNASDRTLLRELTEHTASVIGVAFHPEGHTLASFAWDDTLRIWNANDGGTLLHTLEVDAIDPRSMAFAPDGSILATGWGDGQVRFWRVASGALLTTLPAHEPGQAVTGIAFAQDGQMLVTAALDTTAKVWQLRDGTVGVLLHTLEHSTEVLALAVAPDGQTVATGDSAGVVRVWNGATGTLLHELADAAEPITDVAFDPQGEVIAVASQDGTIRLWHVDAGQLLNTLAGHTTAVGNLAFLPDGHLLASGAPDGTIRLWGVER